MKTLTILFLIGNLSLQLSLGQTFSELYSNETVYLKEVPEYAQMNDWNDLFSDYYQISHGIELGKKKIIVLAPNGSVFMSHKTTYSIWKFDKEGKLAKKFGQKGNGPGEFVMRAKVEGILGGKYLYTTDVQGRMLFFDLDGNYFKNLKLDYMPLRTLPLNHMKIAIFGHVPMGKGRVKNIISILDFESGKEDIIWEDSYDPELTEIKLASGKSMLARLSISFTDVTRYGMVSTADGNLLVASSSERTISEYSTDGKKIRSIHLDIDPVRISDDDINRMYEAQIETFDRFQNMMSEERRLTDEELKQLKAEYKKRLDSKKEEIKAGDPLPLYSTIIPDSEGNILVFEYTKEKDSNEFNAYTLDRDGALIGVSKFVSDDYDLTFSPDNFVFHAKKVYAVAIKKGEDGVPLRLVEFKLSNSEN